MALLKRFEKLLLPQTTALLIIDVQERILPVIRNHKNVVQNTLKLIKGFKVMSLPIFVTEQYPKGLGRTTAELKTELSDAEYFEKMSFSCFGATELFNKFEKKNLTQIVITGVETHVCVQQTVLDLLENGLQVNVAADAVSSRRETDYTVALNRMQDHGAEITTVESILFELLNVCGTDTFKKVSKIVK
ncbi:MAG: hydrolase [Ignavibacteria bacterium]|nr:hydrolase [Ignavibacteria bacterium]MBT8382803.1 hydrolase [Ignavibacteria bacterium]MBT8392690.1 hydrolase [Ignavibacteria bacterium]NNJ52530.1 hydrolase [Ignavibacteriaceae bacterium]NNL21975.1 hydrolase [Ignavibacteriaceae bacterium]